MLGACGDKDIGYYFSDKDPRIKGISSKEIIKKVLAIVKKKGFKIVNVDAVVVAKGVKISSHRQKIINSIAGLLKVNKSCISIKGKSNQGLGIFSKGKSQYPLVKEQTPGIPLRQPGRPSLPSVRFVHDTGCTANPPRPASLSRRSRRSRMICRRVIIMGPWTLTLFVSH